MSIPNAHSHFFAIIPVAIVSVTIGCGSPAEPRQGPSYADLVATYNAELETLNRLENQKQQLEDKLKSVGQPTPEDALKMLDNVLSTTQQAAAEENDKATGDPQAELDQAVERAQKSSEATRDLLKSLGNQPAAGSEAEEQIQQAKKAVEAELESLDREIADQKQRVERARQARDAAESAAR